MLTIDGVEYDVKCRIVRTAELTASDISGLMLDRTYLNDVLGTYMVYEVEFTYPLYNQGLYGVLFDVLSTPVPYHSFVLPYNQDTIELTARVESVSDELVVMESGRRFWKDATFTIIANAPSKTMSLSDVIEHGMTPYPPDNTPQPGDTYAWSDVNGWEPVSSYEDADLIAF